MTCQNFSTPNARKPDFKLKNLRGKIYWPEKEEEEKLLSMSGKNAQGLLTLERPERWQGNDRVMT